MDSNQALIKAIRDCGLHVPESMTLMVTDACNLSCRHCWLDCHTRSRSAPVVADNLSRVIDEFAQLGGTRINLTGGEFFTHPHWLKILRFCLDRQRLTEVCIQSNATLITRGHLDALQVLPLEKLTLQISLDGASAHTHDHVRGSGSFDKAMAGLDLLVEAGFGSRTRVAFTEMAHNFHELPQLLGFVDEKGLARLVCNTLVKGGRAATATHMRLPTPDQYRRLIHRYQTDSVFKTRCDRKASIAAIEWFKHRAGSTDHHCSCIKDLFVDSRGRLYPCTMLLLDDFASQSVHGRPLVQVIDQALAKWRELPILSRDRQKTIASCSQCPFQSHCGGGCMGRAATANGGEFMTPEDRCTLRKAVYRQDGVSDAIPVASMRHGREPAATDPPGKTRKPHGVRSEKK